MNRAFPLSVRGIALVVVAALLVQCVPGWAWNFEPPPNNGCSSGGSELSPDALSPQACDPDCPPLEPPSPPGTAGVGDAATQGRNSVGGGGSGTAGYGHDLGQNWHGRAAFLTRRTVLVRDVDVPPIPVRGGLTGASLGFSRAHASDDFYSGTVGVGWAHPYAIVVYENSNAVWVRQWDGSQRTFEKQAGGTFVDVDEGSGSLRTNANGQYIWTLPHGTAYSFDVAANSNRLLTVTDRVGNTLTLSYNISGGLTNVMDFAGRSLAVTNDAQGRVAQVTAPGGLAVSYAYDSDGQLTNVVDNLGRRVSYLYDLKITNGWKRSFTRAVIDANGHTNSWDYAYQSEWKLVAETNGLGRSRTYVHDGTHVTITNWNGQTLHAYHDSTGAITARVDAAGTTTWDRDAFHRATRKVDRLSKPTYYTYADTGCACPSANNLVQRIDALTRTNSWTWNTNFNVVTSFTDAAGGLTQWQYDNVGNLRTNIDAATKKTVLTWTNGNLTSVQDANLHTTTFGYDTYGNRTGITNALPAGVRMAYDIVGRLTNHVDAVGRSTKLAWDARSRLTRIINGAGETNAWAYDAVGNVTAWTNALRYARQYGYDALDRLTTVTLPGSNGVFLSFAYDAIGNRTNVTDALGHRTGFGYDGLGRLIAVTNALAKGWALPVDAEGRRTAVIDPNSHTNSFVYDAVGQLTNWANANNGTASFSYDRVGNLTQVRDPRSNTLSFGYDAVQRLTSITYTGSLAETFRYDPVGNLTGYVTRAGQTLALTYDAANQLTNKSYVGTSEGIAYAWDAAGQLTGAVWKVGATLKSSVAFTYDNAGRILTEVQTIGTANAKTVTYEYYADGRRKSLTYPNGNVINYEYNTNGWLTAVKDGGASVVTYEYDAAGRRTKRTLENSTYTAYGYDDANQLTNVWHYYVKNGTNATIARFQYGYDNAGNRSWVKRAHDANKGDVYRYDAADQITNVLYNAANPDTSPAAWTSDDRYVYDAAGNRQTVISISSGGTTGTVSYGVNTLNQYTNINANAVTWDANGNLTNSASWTYRYDAENRLTNAVYGATTVSYTYDPFGRLVERNVGGTITRFYYAGWQLIEERGGGGGVQNKYVYGAGLDEPVRMIISSQNYYYHADGLGSITHITRGDASVEERYVYDIYGTPTMYDKNGNLIYVSGFGNRFFFTARDRDPDTGLYNYRYRYYSPSLGRFVQVDPLGIQAGDLSLYAYVHNSPMNAVDAWGLSGEFEGDQVDAILGAIGAAVDALKQYKPGSREWMALYLVIQRLYGQLGVALSESGLAGGTSAAAVGTVGAVAVVAAGSGYVGYRIGEIPAIRDPLSDYYARGSIGSRLPLVQLATPRWWRNAVTGRDPCPQ